MRGEGYFLEIKTGDVVEIYEHYRNVVSNPSRYGLTDADITPDRKETLVKVLRNGFIRVRAQKSQIVFEFDWDDTQAIPVIIRFMKKMGFIGGRWVTINDLNRGTSDQSTASEFMGRYETCHMEIGVPPTRRPGGNQ